MGDQREEPVEPGAPSASFADTVFFQAAAFSPEEEIVASWVASVPAFGVSAYGGNLILTNERLVFQPIKAPRVRSEVWSMYLSDLIDVELIPRKGRLRPGRIALATATEKPKEFMVLHTRRAPIWDRRHDDALINCRDRLRSHRART